MPGNIYPIIFIPGIKGTTLSDHYPIDHRTVYTPVEDAVMLTDFENLLLDAAGQYDQRLDQLIREHEIIGMIYGDMVQELRECLPLNDDKDDHEHARAYLFPYDWRYPVADNAASLSKFADYILAKSSAHEAYTRRGLVADKVNLVCHSMGGCVAKHYATILGGEKKINKLVLLAPPLRGSLEALKQMTMGDTVFFGLGTRKGRRMAARTYPGVYDLLPYDGVGQPNGPPPWPKPAVVDAGTGEAVDIFDVANWQANVSEQLTESVLANRLINARSYFAGAKDFSPRFQKNVLAVYGTGEDTLRQVTFDPKAKEYGFFGDGRNTTWGDGTVPAVSAFAKGVYCQAVDKQSLTNTPLVGVVAGFHAAFCRYSLVQDLAISFLTGKANKSVSDILKVTRLEGMAKFDGNWLKENKEL